MIIVAIELITKDVVVVAITVVDREMKIVVALNVDEDIVQLFSHVEWDDKASVIILDTVEVEIKIKGVDSEI